VQPIQKEITERFQHEQEILKAGPATAGSMGFFWRAYFYQVTQVAIHPHRRLAVPGRRSPERRRGFAGRPLHVG